MVIDYKHRIVKDDLFIIFSSNDPLFYVTLLEDVFAITVSLRIQAMSLETHP